MPGFHLTTSQGVQLDSMVKTDAPEYMPSVLPPYAPSVPLFVEKYAPERTRSGFVTSPHGYAGRAYCDASTASFKQSFHFDKPSPNTSPTSTMAKFQFDRTAALPHIPVASRKLVFGSNM